MKQTNLFRTPGRWPAVAALWLLTLLAPVAVALAQVPINVGGWVPNGTVSVVEQDNDYIYLGGNFTSFAKAGVPTAVGRSYLARLRKTDLEIDLAWNPGASGEVDAIAIGGQDVYVGFVSGPNASRVIKIGRSSGLVDAAWGPVVATNLFFGVQALAVAGSHLYIGGAFGQIGGQPRNNLARVSIATGSLDLAWNPSPNDLVAHLLVSGTDLFVGGAFTSIGGQNRNFIAKLSTTGSGVADPNWNLQLAYNPPPIPVPQPPGVSYVYGMALLGNDLYLGGDFDRVQGLARNKLAKVSTSGVGTVDASWNPNYNGGIVSALAISGGSLYVGTNYSGFALFNLTGTGQQTQSWPIEGVTSLASSGTDVYIGGWFGNFAGQPVQNFAVLSGGNVQVSSFAPANGPVGTPVTITGTGFIGATAVSFGSVNASSFAVVNDTQITTTVPAGAVTSRIRVTAPGGTALSATDFVVPGSAPLIYYFDPANGFVGTTVTITGVGLGDAQSVRFGNVTATNFTVVNPGRVTAVVPAGATTGRIAVVTPSGEATSATDFRVLYPPVVTGFSPASGAVGATVTITGANFSNVTRVSFGTVEATFTVNSPTQITTTVPVGASTGPINMTNPDGARSSASQFTVLPTTADIWSLSPNSGTVGTEVTIFGTGLSEATQVTFNQVVALAFTVISNTQIRATVPVGATTGFIRVTSRYGVATSGIRFTVILPPTITDIAPATGPEDGQVTITGTNFTGVTAVSFNNVAAASFVVNSSTQITATVPVGATTGRIRVTALGGIATSATDFVVIPPPTITSFTPTSGPQGTVVTISGTNFTGATAVSFNTIGAANFVVNSGTQITATVPGATTGRIRVTSTGTATSTTDFVVIQPPRIIGFTPTGGPVGTTVTIFGFHFTGATAVSFNNVAATNFTVLDDTQITATVPMGATTGPIQVTSLAGTSTFATNFAVGPAPTITSFTPTIGAAGTQVTITGTNFTGVISVLFNGNSFGMANFVVNSSTQITAIVPPNVVSSGRIQVNTATGTATSATDFIIGPRPTITSFTPSSGRPGTQVTITGTNFIGATAVNFATVAATNFIVVSSTQIIATVPIGATSGRIWVTTSVGGSSLLSTGFFSVPVSPSITNFAPTRGLPGTQVTITGTNIANAMSVIFNNVPATNFTRVTLNTGEQQVIAIVPPDATTGRIFVTTPGDTATSVADFTVAPSLVLPTSWQPRPNNSSINSIVEDNDYIYLGGSFTSFNKEILGSTGMVFSTAGVGAPVPDFPLIEGIVNTCIPDGNGGWFIGGDSFLRVNGVTRRGLGPHQPRQYS
jgi:hypothetical protein